MVDGTITQSGGKPEVGDFDPWDKSLVRSAVWPLYRNMRAAGPAVWSNAQGGFWNITRFADVQSVARDYQIFSSAEDGVIIGSRSAPAQDNTRPVTTINSDPPAHKRLRKAMQMPFVGKQSQALVHIVDRHLDDILAGLAGKRSFDLVDHLAEPLPVRVISDIVGIPDGETRSQFRRLVTDKLYGGLADQSRADQELFDFFRDVVVGTRGSDSGFIAQVQQLAGGDAQFSNDEIVSMATELSLAGHHTSINAIATMLLHLCTGQDRGGLLSGDTSPDAFIEESLRLDPPVHLEGRTATQDVMIGDVLIAAGSRVALLFASANRDELVYTDPDVFDASRPRRSHVSFGFGIHTCVGAPLARLEMARTLDHILRRLPSLRLADDPVETGFFFGHHMGWKSIPAAI